MCGDEDTADKSGDGVAGGTRTQTPFRVSPSSKQDCGFCLYPA